MASLGIIGLLLLIANIAFSYKGFKNKILFDANKFEVDRILINKEYKRLVTSGFLHVNWTHLIFNMISLIAFSGLLEYQLGGFYLLLIYFASLIGGDLLALLVHRNHGDYSSVGASGAVCGIMFASIALFPDNEINMLFIPLPIPSWLYGIFFVACTMYGVKSNKDNIGHEAHLGGALVGMLMAIILQPSALSENFFTVLLITLPTIVFIYLILTRPHFLLIDNFFFETHNSNLSIDHKYNAKKAIQQKELDKLLDKISSKGIESLSAREKRKLEDYSK